MNFNFLLLLFNIIIIESGYVLGQVSEECKIYNKLNNLDINTDCCKETCAYQNTVGNTCDNEGHVICLDLTKRNLVDIPLEVENLPYLKSLGLGENKFERIPELVFKLKNLEKLDFNRNSLIELPQFLTQMNLKSLSLNWNRIGEIPTFIGDLKTLEYLGFCNNSLNEVPKEIGNLPNLNRLNLGENNLKVLPDELGNLSNLHFLFLDSNPLDALPSSLGKLTQLEQITLKNTNLKTIPPELFNLSNLYSLHLENCSNLDLKLINFGKQLKYCFFNRASISCYQPGTCKCIGLDGNNCTDEKEHNLPVCTVEEINTVRGQINKSTNSNDSSNTLLYIGIALGIVIVIAIIGYICFSVGRKTNKRSNNNNILSRKGTSDVIIYETHKLPDTVTLSSKSDVPSALVSPATPVNSVPFSSPISISSLPVESVPISSLPVESNYYNVPNAYPATISHVALDNNILNIKYDNLIKESELLDQKNIKIEKDSQIRTSAMEEDANQPPPYSLNVN